MNVFASVFEKPGNITINGTEYTSVNRIIVQIDDNQVIFNGELLNITINGDIGEMENINGDINITGNANSIESVNGNVVVSGNVKRIETVNGNVTVSNNTTSPDIETVNGNVTIR